MSVSLQLKPTGEHDFNLGAKLGFQILSFKGRVWVCRTNHSLRITASLHSRERNLQCLQCFNSFCPHIQGAWPIDVNSLHTQSITSLVLSWGKVKRVSRPCKRPRVLLRRSPFLETQSRGYVCTLCDGHAEMSSRAREAGTTSLERHKSAGFFDSWKEQLKYPVKVQSWSAYMRAWKHWLGISNPCILPTQAVIFMARRITRLSANISNDISETWTIIAFFSLLGYVVISWF